MKRDSFQALTTLHTLQSLMNKLFVGTNGRSKLMMFSRTEADVIDVMKRLRSADVVRTEVPMRAFSVRMSIFSWKVLLASNIISIWSICAAGNTSDKSVNSSRLLIQC